MSEEKKHKYKVTITELKSLTWVFNDKTAQSSFEVLINNKVNHDYRVECKDTKEKDDIFKALKYLYWKLNGKNLPIYTVPTSLVHLAFNSKHIMESKRTAIPEKYRVSEED